ncbi:MAG: DUF4124 domain-containing protein [Candidatus Competibacter sp.]|nr:DUF4124 domain-containing protein [Candidatus Competibacter sp.]MDG4584221.1 DUF4124 domain-containing protein [Candidatus Competibacter sp.]
MNRKPLAFLLNTIVLLASPAIAPAQQQVYKWTDASGRVHYGQRKPESTEQVQTLDIAPSPPAGPASTDSAAEIARINALSEQMASEREAAEKARQEQALRNLELKNQELQNSLLKQQLEQQQQQQQQQQSDDNSTIIGYPPLYNPAYPYPPPNYPPYPPYPPGPPPHRPCAPWPDCRQPPPEPPPRPRPPLAKPNPPFNPAPAGLAPQSQGVFKGR